MSVWRTGVVGAGNFEDPANARIIYLAAGGLVLLAVLLGVGTWMWWRRAKVEHPVLGPLEVMGTRRWRRTDDDQERGKVLAAVRLPDHPEAVAAAEPAPVPELIDLDGGGDRGPADFADLSEGGAPARPVEVIPVEEPVADDTVSASAPIDPLLRLNLND